MLERSPSSVRFLFFAVAAALSLNTRERASSDESAAVQNTLTICGFTRAEQKPLPDVKVVLYRVHRQQGPERIKESRTDAVGRYEFGDLWPLSEISVAEGWHYAVVATAPARAS